MIMIMMSITHLKERGIAYDDYFDYDDDNCGDNDDDDGHDDDDNGEYEF